jgi:hypothetical protein
MRFGTCVAVIDALEPPPLEPLAEPSADIFGAALLCGAPNLGKAIGIRFNQLALHGAAPYNRDEKRHAAKNSTIILKTAGEPQPGDGSGRSKTRSGVDSIDTEKGLRHQPLGYQ